MKVLVTAGPVYAHLDDNKILSSLTRGLWAKKFADYLVMQGRHTVTTLFQMEYWKYRRECVNIAPDVDAAVMAAAVINYVPREPFEGKMPTDLDEVEIVLRRAPYVIDEIRKINPRCKLIGCKLTSREPVESLVAKAQQLMDRTGAHAVIANDKSCLRVKRLCFPDGAVIPFDDDFPSMYSAVNEMIRDRHYSTVMDGGQGMFCPDSNRLMVKLLERNSPKFKKPWAGGSKNFGSIAVRIGIENKLDYAMMTPRMKSDAVDAFDCPTVTVNDRNVVAVKTCGLDRDVPPRKATMNAPLLWDVLRQHPDAAGVVHLHEFDASAPILPYAPAGTVRDSLRGSLPRRFNIEHHGLVACVNWDGDFI